MFLSINHSDFVPFHSSIKVLDKIRICLVQMSCFCDKLGYSRLWNKLPDVKEKHDITGRHCYLGEALFMQKKGSVV